MSRKREQSLVVRDRTASYPPLASTSLAVIGCVLKRSPDLRPLLDPPGKYRRARRRPPSEPSFTARSRENVDRPASRLHGLRRRKERLR